MCIKITSELQIASLPFSRKRITKQKFVLVTKYSIGNSKYFNTHSLKKYIRNELNAK